VLTGRWHRIHENDTISTIAAMYGTDPETLAELNDLRDDRALSKRKAIFVPMHSGKVPGLAEAPANADAAVATTTAAKPEKTAPSNSEPAPSEKKSVSCESAGNICLAWPLEGRLGAGFHPKNANPHDGLDILAEKGALIHAAESGEVLYSGAEIKGYGNLVILRHKDGLLTIYAHNDKNLVSEGARVERGDVIAEAGQSGNATAVHLHFEVRAAEVPKDPRLYLPPPK